MFVAVLLSLVKTQHDLIEEIGNVFLFQSQNGDLNQTTREGWQN